MDMTFGKTSNYRPLQWPLNLFMDGNTRVKDLEIYSPRSRFSLRMARYWFAASEIDLELLRLAGPATIVDLGCERGITKGFSPERDNVCWIGLDWNITRPELLRARYHKMSQCDFDKELPLVSGCADIVVCLHVFEHLPRPEFTVGEIARVLKPGGLLIAATPVVPDVLTRGQEAYYRREFRHGRAKPAGHIKSFSPGRWRTLIQSRNLRCDMVCGAYLLRWTGNPLENSAWWIRLNQIWGGSFPGMGGEIFIVARKGQLEKGAA